MRRFLRRLATIIKVFLLVAGLATIALWCRSYFAWDLLTRVDRIPDGDSRAYTLRSLRSEKGELVFDREECLRLQNKNEGSNQAIRQASKKYYYHTSSQDDPNLASLNGEGLFYEPPDRWIVLTFPRDMGSRWGGFQMWKFTFGQSPMLMDFTKVTRRLLLIRIPFWSIATLLLAWPVISHARRQLLRSRQRRRLQASRCLACGYDLRATPDVCPECGTPRQRSNSF